MKCYELCQKHHVECPSKECRLWIEYGEEQYEDAMSRQDTINYMSNKGFSLIDHFSSKGDKGDLLFRRSS